LRGRGLKRSCASELLEVVAPQEPDLGIEVVAHLEQLDPHAVAVGAHSNLAW
jgi:hypothetical protein